MLGRNPQSIVQAAGDSLIARMSTNDDMAGEGTKNLVECAWACVVNDGNYARDALKFS
jgi:hypothetical protein